MATPNPFGDAGADNPFMAGGGGMNPYMAQQQAMAQQAAGYGGYPGYAGTGYAQYGGHMQQNMAQANPFGGGMDSMGSMGSMGYGQAMYGQQQPGMYGQPQQFGGGVAHMNTHTNSVPSNAGAALFGTDIPTTTNAGAALFGVPEPAMHPPPIPSRNMSAMPVAPVAEANPFADVAPPSQVISPQGTGYSTPGSSVSQRPPQVHEVNPFADAVVDIIPKIQPEITGQSQVVSQHASGTVTPGSGVTNPFADAPEEQVKPVEHHTASGSEISAAASNPFADDDVQIDPAAQMEVHQENVVAREIATMASPPNRLDLTINKPTVALVQEMVGGLEVSTADMMGKLELAKTPTIPEPSKTADTSSEDESDSEDEKECKPDISEVKSEVNQKDAPEIKVETESDVNEAVTDGDKSTGFGEIFNAELAPNSETLQTATSFVDLPNESKKEDESESDSDSDKEEDNKQAEEKPDIDEKQSDELRTGGTAAGLFDDGGFNVGGTGASLFGGEISEPAPAVKMSTGAAIFTDMPSVPDIKSTGAAIFGVSDESAAGTTGAALFDIQAPEAAKPSHGQMSGWDDAFDQKFQVAGGAAANPSTAHDAFGGGASMYPNNFAYPATMGMPEPEFGDSFGMKPVEVDMNNPFMADGLPGPGEKSGDGETPETPLFDADVSKPLEDFPRLKCETEGWEMYIRHPPKKKITSQRFWKKVLVKIVMQADNPAILLFNSKDDKDPFQELPLQAAYSLSDVSHQVFDQYSKVFTIKLQYIFYKERAGIRPGQVTKMQKLTDKIGFLAKAVEEADAKGVREFASDMKKLGVPLEHAPQISELLKLASTNYEDVKQFSVCIEEKLFRLDVHRDRALTYKTEEVQMTAVDEVYLEQDDMGHIIKHVCRVRVFFLSFLTGMPEVDLGVNDMTRMGLEVVGRHDILPVPTEQWIRYENIEFHNVVDKKAFESEDHVVKFKPPDACYIEVMRFRTRPPKARELPLQARCSFTIVGQRVEIRSDVMIPYHATKAWGQVPCEDVAIRIPLPECWIYQFRTEKHNMSLSQVRGALSTGNINLGTRMGSVKSAHKRMGKVKGIDRFLGTMETASQELMETSSGVAKYEHQHKAIVWRVPRLPKQGQGSYTTHEFLCKLTLTSYDQMPEEFDKHFTVEFTQPATQESYTVLRSVSVNEGSGEPPEKFVKYLARHEYKVGIKFVSEKEQDSYRAATAAVPESVPVLQPGEPEEETKTYEDFPEENGNRDQDSDSD